MSATTAGVNAPKPTLKRPWYRNPVLAIVALAVIVLGVVSTYVLPHGAPVGAAPVGNALEQHKVVAQTESQPVCTSEERLENGSNIARPHKVRGRGESVVDNGTPYDATVRLVSSNTDSTVRWVYVRQGEKTAVNRIPPGAYRLLFTTGSNWKPDAMSFTCDESYLRFEKLLNYAEREEEDKIGYDQHRITLNPVPFGNVHAAQISRAEFMKGHENSSDSQE